MATSATLRAAGERQKEGNWETEKLEKLGNGKSRNCGPGTTAGFALLFSFAYFFLLSLALLIFVHDDDGNTKR